MTDQTLWAEGRGQMYRFLSAAFLAPPSERFVAPFLTGAFLKEMEAAFEPATIEDLSQFAREFQGDYERLDQEFQGLFMVPLGRYVTPYEAVYRDEREVGDTRLRGLLMGPSTLAVKQLYREAGMAISEDYKDLPDHVGLELACMEFLCQVEGQAWEREDLTEVRRVRHLEGRLLHDHLLQWVPALCQRIRENAPGPFYRGIASLTMAYLSQESKTVDDRIEAWAPLAG
jgi:TorA maturation chaperone TorD